VLLAAVFGLGFVLFGIGAGGTGLGDIFRDNNGGGGGPNVKKALEATQQRPRDPQAWLALADVYRTNGDTDKAVSAQVHYTQLAPKNADGFRTLAGDYFTQAREHATDVQNSQIADAYSGRVSPVQDPTLNGTSLFESPFSSLSSSTSGSSYTNALQASQTALNNAVAAYDKVAALAPNDPNVQSEVGSNALQAAQLDTTSSDQVAHVAVAVKAFRRYLKLAPDSSDAPLIQRQLNQLLKQTGSP
jgi:tetratricopeptide (TPR) repeat protein